MMNIAKDNGISIIPRKPLNQFPINFNTELRIEFFMALRRIFEFQFFFFFNTIIFHFLRAFYRNFLWVQIELFI